MKNLELNPLYCKFIQVSRKKCGLKSFLLEILFFSFIIEESLAFTADGYSPPVNGGATRGGGFDEA